MLFELVPYIGAAIFVYGVYRVGKEAGKEEILSKLHRRNDHG